MHNVNQEIKVQVEELSSIKKKLNIIVSKDAVASELKAAYQDLRAKTAIAGFRKGTVPMNILKARYGDSVLKDVMTHLIEHTYAQALHEKNLVPVESPKVDLEGTLEEGKEFAYSATFESNPKVEVDNYKNIDVKLEKFEVTDKDVEEGITRLREGHAAFKEVDTPAGNGDLVNISFEAFLDGKPLKEYKAEDYPMILGEGGEPLPGFFDAIRGIAKGQTRESVIKFPESYTEHNLGGKEAVFNVTVKSVKQKVVPNYDLEFAKGMGCEDLDTLKARVKEEIIKIKDINEKEKAKTAILDTLVERYDFEVPEALVKRYYGIIIRGVADNLRKGIADPADKGLTQEQIQAKYNREAERRVREDVILDAIAAKEKVEVSREEFEAAVRKLAESRGISHESLMSRIMKEGTEDIIRDGLKHEKVFDIIIEAAAKR